MTITYEEAVSRCWAEVDLSRLVQNYKNALAHLNGHTQLICVLKADAYGLGLPMVAKRLRQEGQRFFAVASYNEAAQLRRAVPDSEVLILGLCSMPQLIAAIHAGMLLTVFSSHYAQQVIQAAQQAGCSARVHMKLETGLHRLGFMPEEALSAALSMQASGCIALEGLFTHLALRNRTSDLEQLRLLTNCRDTLHANGIHPAMVHALDSIGMVRYPDFHLDAVRTGAWLYGVYPRRYAHPEESQLTLTVKTRIAQLHHVAAGECLGYDENNPLTRDCLIATLSAGYIDGYPRLCNAGQVEIRGQRAPVAGLVCMDQMMVDVSHIPGVQEGDEVTLLGGSIGVDEYAEIAGLNRNESLARTGRRVPRVYLENVQVVFITEALD